MQALIFDCDGVLVDTERDGHRVAFNAAFAESRLDTTWSVERYAVLLGTAGGKERLRRHFDEAGWPVREDDKDDFVARLHKTKTRIFMELIATGKLPLRPGIARIIDEALEADLRVAVCSTSNEKAVQAIVDVLLGPDRSAGISVFAGDMVPAKKPDPAIYLLALKSLDLDAGRCLVIEDSHIGLKAALAARMRCLVTRSSYTGNEDFGGAARVVDDLGDITLGDCRQLLKG